MSLYSAFAMRLGGVRGTQFAGLSLRLCAVAQAYFVIFMVMR